MQAKMTKSELAEKIKEKFGYQCKVAEEVQVTVTSTDWKKLAEFLKATGLDYFSFMTAVDRKEKFVVVARFENLSEKLALQLYCELSPGQKLPSLAEVYTGADWMEREIYDMFGIEFVGHPNLKRILMPEDYQGFPLRKEFPLDQRYEPYR